MRTGIARLWLTLREGARVAIGPQTRRQVLHSRLYGNSVYLMTNSAVSAALGFVFWIVVARLYPTEAVGLGSALISAAGLLAFLASLGLGTGLIRFLPSSRGDASALINSCFTLSGLVAIAVAAVFVAGLPLWSPALVFVRENGLFVATFIVFVVVTTLSTLLCQVFVAFRRTEFILIQGVLTGLLKLMLVVLMAGFFKVFGIFASWGMATAVAVAVGVFPFLSRLQPGYRPLPSLKRQVSNEMIHFSFANYASIGLWTAPTWLLPLLVVNLLGGQANAYFYVSWAMAGLLFAIPLATSTSLFAEGSYREELLARDVRRTLKATGVLLLPAVVVMVAAGDKLLLLFGREYSLEGAKLLWVLAPSAVPVSINLVYLGIARVKKWLKDVILVATAVGLGTLGLSYILLPHLGILGPTVGWLVSHTLVAIAVLPKFTRALRPTQAEAWSEGRPSPPGRRLSGL